MSQDTIFRIGEVRRVAATVNSDTAFTVTSVAAHIYNAAGTAIVNGSAGGVDTSDPSKEHEVYYLWDTTGGTAGDYRYILTYVIGTQTFKERGTVILLSVTSFFDAWVDRIIDWLVDSEAGEAQRAISFRQYREAATTAVREYSRYHPRKLQATQALTSGTWEYDLPSGWQDDFSHIEWVEYPVDSTAQPRTFYRSASLYEDEVRDKWMFASISPSTGQNARLTYTVPHTLSDSVDSVPTHHFQYVTKYAAGEALEQLANRASGTSAPNFGADMGNFRSQQEMYRAQARVMKEEARMSWGSGISETPELVWSYLEDHNRYLPIG